MQVEWQGGSCSLKQRILRKDRFRATTLIGAYEEDPPPDPVSRALQQMRPEQREQLQYFFQRLISQEGLGYVLFGRKPLSVAPIRRNESAWQLWEQLQGTLPKGTRFILRLAQNPDYTTGSLKPRVKLLVASRENVLRELQRERPLNYFQRVLGLLPRSSTVESSEAQQGGHRPPVTVDRTPWSPEDIWQALQTECPASRRLLQNTGTFETLLGHGFQNALLCQRFNRLWDPNLNEEDVVEGVRRVPLEDKRYHTFEFAARVLEPGEVLRAARPFTTLQEELNHLARRLGMVFPIIETETGSKSSRHAQPSPPVPFPPASHGDIEPVHFKGVSEYEDTQTLRAGYEADRQPLRQLVRQHDFLLTVLRRLTQPGDEA